MTARLTTPQLTVTIRPDSVVFEGAANVHRHDNPSTSDIAAAICKALGSEPAGAHVHIVGDEETIDDLVVLTSGYDIVLTSETTKRRGKHALRPNAGADAAETSETAETGTNAAADATGASAGSDAHPRTTEWEEITLRRPTLYDGSRETFLPAGTLLVLAVTVIGALCAAAIWAVARSGSDASERDQVHGPSGDAATSKRASPTAPSASTPPPSSARQPESVTLTQDGLSVEVPVGFTLEPDEDMWRATGPDPDFRLQLAVDPLYGVAGEAVINQVEQEILADPELHVTERDDLSISYKHMLPDGSHAQWRAWIDGGHQISIGCHTRTAPTTVQQATCAMANDSARYSPP
nr:type VII secretion-associated protein, Rv3446c family [Streptococcus thermophilus]